MNGILKTIGAALCSMVVSGGAGAATVSLQQATATFSQTQQCGPALCNVGSAIDGDPVTGWAIFNFDTNSTIAQTAVFETTANLFTNGGFLTFQLDQLYGTFHTIGRFRLSATTDDRSLFADGLDTGGDVSANWTVLSPVSAASANGASLSLLGDSSILAGGFNPTTDIYTVTVSTALSGITGFRIEMLEDDSLGPQRGPGRQPNGNFVLSNFAVDAVAYSAPAVPEPSTWAMMIAGFGLAGVALRRRSAAVSFA